LKEEEIIESIEEEEKNSSDGRQTVDNLITTEKENIASSFHRAARQMTEEII
jgi:hypothetical protein